MDGTGPLQAVVCLVVRDPEARRHLLGADTAPGMEVGRGGYSRNPSANPKKEGVVLSGGKEEVYACVCV